MELNRELLFFFSALGAFNGVVLGLYFLFFTKTKHISNRFFGVFLLMLSIRVGKSVFFHFNPELSFHYLQLGLTGCFFIGPFLYFYVNSALDDQSKILKTWKYHLAVLIPIVFIVGFLYPFKSNVVLWRTYFIKAIYIQWFIYILASLYSARKRIKEITQKKGKRSILDIWMLSILFGNLVLVFSYYFTSFVNYLSGALTFSFLFYVLLMLLFFNKKNRSIIFKKVEKYADKKIDQDEASSSIERLKEVMKNDELFKDANLKSSDVSKKIGLSTHQFSQLLNDNLGKNFALFVNEYRIEEAKRMLLEDTKLTLEVIGYECGFNSKSTFYTTFKKLVGKTPKQFRTSNL